MLLSSLFQVGRIEKAGRRRKKREQTMMSELRALHAGDYPANLSDYRNVWLLSLTQGVDSEFVFQ